MVSHAYEYAVQAKQDGRRIVGTMCEYTPRELILAAGAVPVCLCGGSYEMSCAAERVLPVNLCPLIKSTYGFSLEKKNPFLEMADLLVAETTCDGKKKMYELLAKRHKMQVLELPQKPDDKDAFIHWVSEINKLKARLESEFGIKITDNDLRSAVRQMNAERALKRELYSLMKSDNPPLTGHDVLVMSNNLIACMPEYHAKCREIIALAKETPCRLKNNDKTRVLLTGVPVPHGAEAVLDIIEDNGAVVVCQENCSGLKPVMEDVVEGGDVIKAIAKKYYHLPCSVMTPNDDRFRLLERLVHDYRPDCIVDLVWRTCITYDVESAQVKELSGRLGLPFLKIEADYSPSDQARLSVRLKALFETATGRKRLSLTPAVAKRLWPGKQAQLQ